MLLLVSVRNWKRTNQQHCISTLHTQFPHVVQHLFPSCLKSNMCTEVCRGRDSSDGIATCYGLDGPGIESRWGRNFLHPSRPALGLPSLQYNGYQVSFTEVNRPGRGVNHPPPSSTQVEERIGLYLCSASGPSWPLLEYTFTEFFRISYATFFHILKTQNSRFLLLRYYPIGEFSHSSKEG